MSEKTKRTMLQRTMDIATDHVASQLLNGDIDIHEAKFMVKDIVNNYKSCLASL